jgi:hypothetical protein
MLCDFKGVLMFRSRLRLYADDNSSLVGCNSHMAFTNREDELTVKVEFSSNLDKGSVVRFHVL